MTRLVDPLDAAQYAEVVRRALAEDLGTGDVTTEALVPADLQARAVIVSGSSCVLAGLDVALEAFRQLDAGVAVEAFRHDGECCVPGDQVVAVTGVAAALLTAERTALNILQRLSGVATLTRRFVEAAAGRIVVLDTRKTTPTLRVLEKYAVRVGGARNHRLTLDGAILVKDNHVSVAGGMSAALRRLQAIETDVPTEVEVDTLDQLDAVLDAGVSRVLLDNMSVAEIGEAVQRCRGRAEVEVSGGVTLDRMPAIAGTGADFVSVGALTHSAVAADFSLDLEPCRGEVTQ